MMNNTRLSRRIHAVALTAAVACNGLVAWSAQAESRVAVQSGAWNSSKTWGGPVPDVATDQPSIPAGITVTVPVGASVQFYKAKGWGSLDVAGNLVVEGTAVFAILDVKRGASVTVTPTGQLQTGDYYRGFGSLLNQGTILNFGRRSYQYGPLINEAGALLNNVGTLQLSGAAIAVNRGTILNEHELQVAMSLHNHGALLNKGVWLAYRNMQNFADAMIENTGWAQVHGAVTIENHGTFDNSGQLHIDGKLINTCSGTYSGSAPAGNPPQLQCATEPAPSASVRWEKISAPGRWSSVSARSASEWVGTSGDEPSAMRYLLTGSGSEAAYYTGAGSSTKLAMEQTSVGADGTWWGVKADHSIWRLTSSGWTTVPGSLKQVAVGRANDVWGVNAFHKIYRWDGHGWTRIEGALAQVSVSSDGAVWGVTPEGKIVRRVNGGWETMPGEAVQVAVGRANQALVVNASGAVYQWKESEWMAVADAGVCQAVAMAEDGSLFVIRSADGAVYRRR